MADTHNGRALTTAAKYYSDYGVRARELKDTGSKILGYLSALCPVEIITAAGMVPLRLKGHMSEPITRGDAYMETIVCPFVRNVFDAALKGKYSFLDGMVLPHQCDSIDRTYEIWSNTLKLPYWHFLTCLMSRMMPPLSLRRDPPGICQESGRFHREANHQRGHQQRRRGPQ